MKVFGFTGHSGAGKTTLIEGLIRRFAEQELRVSSIKHAREGIPFDQDGKDSRRHVQAGSREVLLVSGKRWMLQHESDDEPELTLAQQIALLSPCDLVLLEGYKAQHIPRIAVFRAANRKPFEIPDIAGVCAVASDIALDVPYPTFDLDDHDGIASFILERLALRRKPAPLRLVSGGR
ncbi:MAG TPA: molybdopterin-guanine dinucleotide biosynthesis protein B [Rhodocyclaceae bacterium]